MLVGYARVCTDDQNLQVQRDALERAGCDTIYTDHQSGASAERPGLTTVFEVLRGDDTLVIWRLDRLGRSLKDVIHRVEQVERRGAGLRSLQENIDTTTRGGRRVFHLFGALAECERNLVRDRTQAGLSAARARGRLGGRPKALDPTKRAVARRLHREREHSIRDICRMMGISKSTLYNYLAESEADAHQPA